MSVEDDRLGEYVRAEAYLQIRGTGHDPRGHDADLDECRDAIEDAVTLWTDEGDVTKEWVEKQAEKLHGELYR